MTLAGPVDGGFVPVAVRLRDGRNIMVRSVIPGDREQLQAAMQSLTAESRYSRFMTSVRELSPHMLDRAVNPVPGRELQLVAIHGAGAQQAIVGGARYSAAAGSKDCEFSLTVAENWRSSGLARKLLETLMRAARDRGFERMEGYVLATNAPMLGLAGRLGFTRLDSPEGPSVRLVQRDLSSLR